MITRQYHQPATIKGLFVNSHVTALRKKMGDEAVDELKRLFGRPVRFEAFAAVPIHDEVHILELALDLMNDRALAGSERAEAAGALHFTNFAQTPLGGALMRSLPHTPGSLRILLHNAPSIARIVFAHTEFRCEDYNKDIIITINNCDYPLEHFQGFFGEWMSYWGLTGATVSAKVVDPGVHEYQLSFGALRGGLSRHAD